jgi:hypothetical protein
MGRYDGEWRKCDAMNSGKVCHGKGHTHVSHRNIWGKVVWYYGISGQKPGHQDSGRGRAPGKYVNDKRKKK